MIFMADNSKFMSDSCIMKLQISGPTSIELITVVMTYKAIKSNAFPIETLKVVAGVKFVVLCFMSSCSLALAMLKFLSVHIK